MRGGRATGPDDIPMDFWNVCKVGIKWLTEFFYYFNVIFRTTKMSEESRRSTVILLYKNKSDIQNYNNCRSIKLLSHTMKVQERAVEMRTRRHVSILRKQFRFMLGRPPNMYH